jgi:protein ImuB
MARPVVLHARRSRGGEIVVACSAAAWQRGIRPGMPLGEAAALEDPSAAPLLLEPHDAAADRAALERLAAWCQRFAPFVGLETAERPECLLLDVTGLGPLAGGEKPLARRVVDEFARRGYRVRAGLADTIGAAWAAARFAAGAARCEAGGSAFVVPRGENFSFLLPLPLAALRLAEATVELFAQFAVERVADLAALPRADVTVRFGSDPLQRLDQAAGTLQEVFVPSFPPAALEASWELECPTQRRETVEQLLARLVEHVSASLAEQKRGVLELECLLRCEGTRSAGFRLVLARPTARPRHLQELIRLQLERLWNPGRQAERLPGAVVGAGVRAAVVAPLEERQGELLDGSRSSRRQELAALADRLGSRLGRECVVRAGMHADPLPERASRLAPVAGDSRRARPKNSSREKEPSRRPPLAAGDRPLQLQSPPEGVEVIAVAPDGPPVRFRWRNRQYRVSRHWGPERIETGWWRGRTARRDYYRVEVGGGGRYWLFRRLDDGRWFLHGVFV